MTEKPKDLQEIVPESVLIKYFGLPKTKFKESKPKSGKSRPKPEKSRTISSWIRQGLKYFEISGYRFFLKADLLDFLWKKYKELAG